MNAFALSLPTMAARLLFAASLAIATLIPGYANTQPESTLRMVERLASLDREVDPSVIMFVPDQAISFFRERIEQAPNQRVALSLRPPYAMALLNSGDSQGAIAEFQAFREAVSAMGMRPNPQMVAEILKIEALCYLRLGEQENCLHNHNADSCLFPIKDGGVHSREFGSRKAIEKLEQLLEIEPTPYAIWLLNIAYMTLGEYPDQVPASWRLPPEKIQSEQQIARFPDVAGPLGLDVDDLSGGVVMEDFDQDGYLDLLASSWGEGRQLRYFRNNGDGSFSELTDQAWLSGLTGGLNMTPGDYDNDGLVDVLVLREGWLGKDGRFPNSLLRNNGDNTFTDVTEQSGLLSFHPTQTATWFDFNNDGWLDIFIGNETVPESGAADPCELYRNNGDGTFTECAAEHGLDIKDWIKGVVSGDFNNDGRPDLYLSSLVGPNRLLRNDGPADGSADPLAPYTFADVAEQAGVTEPNSSFPCWFFDYNNDGWLDIFVTGYSITDAGDVLADYLGTPHAGERARLYQNNGDGTFSDVTRAKGLYKVLHAMGCNFGDIDSDGWLDFYVGTGDPHLGTIIPNRMFRNDAARSFLEVTTSGGFGQLQKGHGIAFGDLNQDGAQDIYSVVGGAFSGDNYHNQLFANPGHQNHWLKLRLEGVTSNRIALGARVKAVVDTQDGPREIHRVVSSGGSFGASPFLLDIGLGDAASLLRIEIDWPASGKTQVVNSLQLDRAYHIREDSPTPQVLPQKSFSWPSPAAHQSHHHHH
ncbi:FG-GAP-like repeat-containing protein [Pelagicoccus sp. SDUM812003]|uniref:FG-GAP-like repeat-containing protein n=1 Tax=Pelagicoccus sp. SDUM812003 TaxID=3041267 RepID=UPI00280C4F0B|nr:FG-GAP-like repeat-containing protein [Pelagicoccus sp. SDUM812003]MDQ8204748.1 FG-GAP-like repeat-containing protein [Pelagicoccus sp. SDUM812003]